MKVYIHRDELWPFYEVSNGSSEDATAEDLIEVPDELIDRWRTCRAELVKVQALLGEALLQWRAAKNP